MTRARLFSVVAVLLVFHAWSLPILAQGVLVEPRPDRAVIHRFELEQVDVDATVRDQVAQVQMTQVFHNPTNRVIEARYLFPLPHDAAVQDVVLLVDGKELAGRVLERDEARRIYEDIVRRARDPALVEYIGQGLFRTSVFPIEPGKKQRVTLRATYLCPKEQDQVEFAFPLAHPGASGKPVGELTGRVRIESKQPIKAIHSPSHAVAIERVSDHEAVARFEQHDTMPSDLRLFYSVGEGEVGATLRSYRAADDEDGYFMLLASPSVQAEAKQVPKTVVFVIDKSGSMSGKKIEQARDALRFVLNNLRSDDLFNIVAYDDQIETFRPELERFTPERRKSAARFVDDLRAGGSTNIDAALQRALQMLAHNEERPAYVVFLTDGLPTAGERDEQTIARNAGAANKAEARVFSFGVGHDVNARLLDRISHANHGTTEFVAPDEDLEVALSRFYARISSPALTDIEITIDDTTVNRAYPRELPDLFHSGQLVWVGRYSKPGPVTLRLRGRVGDEPYELTMRRTLHDAGDRPGNAFLQRLWATRRIGHLIDQLDLNGHNEELIEELVRLSKRYGILTPYTSFLADDAEAVNDMVRANEVAEENVSTQLGRISGASANQQRAQKRALMDAAQAAPAEASLESMVTTGEPRRARQMQQVADKTFIRRDGVWVDTAVREVDIDEAPVVRQFSDEYFELARNQSATWNRYLTMDEPVVVQLGAQVYRILPPEEGG
ncbi:MAG: VIT domain-containing protein [Phycisphaeraceae bacterium]